MSRTSCTVERAETQGEGMAIPAPVVLIKKLLFFRESFHHSLVGTFLPIG